MLNKKIINSNTVTWQTFMIINRNKTFKNNLIEKAKSGQKKEFIKDLKYYISIKDKNLKDDIKYIDFTLIYNTIKNNHTRRKLKV